MTRNKFRKLLRQLILHTILFETKDILVGRYYQKQLSVFHLTLNGGLRIGLRQVQESTATQQKAHA